MRILTAAVLSAALGVAAKTLYLDCGGDDGRSGLTAESAWKNMAKANDAALQPGDSLLFKRGCAWTGPLNMTWSGNAEKPVFIGAYGTGAMPKIENGNPDNVTITGNYAVIESLAVRSDPAGKDPGCRDQAIGWRVGFSFRSGSNHNLLRGSQATEHAVGAHLAAGSHHNRILNSVFAHNTVMSVNDTADHDNDAGAVGVLVNGDDNEIAYNRFADNHALCSYDYLEEGSSVEIYEAKRNRVHHNRSEEELTFTELGGARTDSTLFAYNLVTSKLNESSFIILRGAESKWGPNLNTSVYNNTVYLTGPRGQAVVCNEGCGPQVLDLRNNILWGNWKAIYVDKQPAEGNNIYWKEGGNPLIENLTPAATSKRADPMFVNAAAADFRLKPGSPALNAGAVPPTPIAFSTDLDGLPVSGAPDIGAFEYDASAGLRPRRASGSIPPSSQPASRMIDLAGRKVRLGLGNAGLLPLPTGL
jgi:hypothetical protein